MDNGGFVVRGSGASGLSGAEAQALIDAAVAAYVAKSLFDANTVLVADTDNTPTALTVAASRILGRKATGGIAALTAAELKAILALAVADISGAAPLASPTFTGTVTVPTPSNGTDAATKNYADTKVPFTEVVATVASSGTSQTLADPAATGTTVTRVTLTGNCTFTMPTAGAGKSLTVSLTQDGTGSRTATFTGVKWAAGIAPTFSIGAGKTDVVTFTCIDGTNWFGFLAGLDMR